jgi:Zn-dependent protease with chaperone function
MPALKIPYPPSPAHVPEGLTDYPATYRRQQNLLLAGLYIFLLLYLGLIVLFALLGVWCFVSMHTLAPLKIAGMVLSGTFFLFLVKGFFKRTPVEKELQIEVTEEEQPVLFGFIQKVCEELDAPEPNRVFLSLDVNAAVIPRASLVNLFVEPKKDLLIGLGLVNVCNLSEFKSVMAHEFGHFSQSAHAASYSYIAHRIIVDLIAGEDWFDRMVDWCKRQDNALKVFGYTIGSCLWVGRKALEWLFEVITLQRMVVMREQEFHADLCAVKAGGSDAVVLSLLRLRFGNLCLQQAVHDLSLAADHKLYTRDVFYHQEKAEAVVRRKKKDPKLGLRPHSDDPMAGKRLRLFDPDQEELDHEEIPEMRRTHPPAHELEENAKATFIPAVVDIRSPWILFADADDLKERLTYKFYRMAFRVPKGVELADPERVQEYIDNEHAETTYDEKYHGVYDDRKLEPGEIAELNQVVRESPWADDRIDNVLAKLYDGCKDKAEEFAGLHKELNAIQERVVGRPSPKMRRMIDDIEKKIDRVWEWFKSFDRRVYLVHVQMAAAVNEEWRDDLVERYRFQMEVQRFYAEARSAFDKALCYLNAAGQQRDLPPEFFAELMQVLRESWRTLKKIVQDAQTVNLPAMQNFAEGERLADFILEGKLVPEPPLTFVKAAWVDKLLNQLSGVKARCFRLHFKSVGGILALQERIAAAWQAQRAPLEAEILAPVEAEVVEALPAEPVVGVPIGVPVAADPTAEVPVAEVLDGEILEAVEVLDPATVGEVIEATPVLAAWAAPVLPLPVTEVPPPNPAVDPVIEAPAPAEPPPSLLAIAARLPLPRSVTEDPVFAQEFASATAEWPPASPAEVAPAAGPPPTDPAGEVFALDAAAPPPSGEVFSLDLDEQPAEDAVPLEQSASGSEPTPAAAAEDPAPAPSMAKPTHTGRPPVRITIVRPGEKSPLAGS